MGLILTTAEKDALTKLAELEGGLSMAALIRRLIRDAAGRHGIQFLASSDGTEIAGTPDKPLTRTEYLKNDQDELE
jgi:hypothetical protein